MKLNKGKVYKFRDCMYKSVCKRCESKLNFYPVSGGYEAKCCGYTLHLADHLVIVDEIKDNK